MAAAPTRARVAWPKLPDLRHDRSLFWLVDRPPGARYGRTELEEARMRLLAGTGNVALAEAIAGPLGTALVEREIDRFPDGEVSVDLDPDLRDDDVYIVQPLGPPVDEHIIELLMVADAVRRCGARSITAVIPYLGYARQDRRTAPGQPVSVRVLGELLATAGFARAVVVDAHTREVEAILSVPVEPATAVPVLAEALAEDLPEDAVIVAPDLGAVGLAQRYARRLGRPVALVRKTRVSGDEVRAGQVVGDVRGCQPVLVDDMISTGGTLVAAAEALIDAGSDGDVTVAVTHGLLVEGAAENLGRLPLRRFLLSDTLPPPTDAPVDVETVSIGPLLAEVIRRLDAGSRLDDLETFH